MNRPERQEMWRRNVALARVTDVAQTVEGATQLQLVITLVAGGRESKFWGGVVGFKGRVSPSADGEFRVPTGFGWIGFAWVAAGRKTGFLPTNCW